MIQPTDPYRYLAAATVLQAIREASKGDLEARIWLLTGGQLYLEALDIDMDPDRMRAWFDAGCPLKKRLKVFGARGKAAPKNRAPTEVSV